MCMTGLIDAHQGEFSLTLSQIAEHLYFHLPAKKGFEDHLEHAKNIIQYLLEEGLVEETAIGIYAAKLRIEGHSLPELIHQAAREINLKI
jgi:hypothetical protein